MCSNTLFANHRAATRPRYRRIGADHVGLHYFLLLSRQATRCELRLKLKTCDSFLFSLPAGFCCTLLSLRSPLGGFSSRFSCVSGFFVQSRYFSLPLLILLALQSYHSLVCTRGQDVGDEFSAHSDNNQQDKKRGPVVERREKRLKLGFSHERILPNHETKNREQRRSRNALRHFAIAAREVEAVYDKFVLAFHDGSRNVPEPNQPHRSGILALVKRPKMSIEKRAIEFVQRYLEKRWRQVENVAYKRHHPGYDFIATNDKKRIRIEVKGCSRRWGIPDLYFTEVAKSPKCLVADYLYVVYFIGRESPRLCKIPRKAIKSEFFIPKMAYRISGRFKNERMLSHLMD
jgi:hypothetical protein